MTPPARALDQGMRRVSLAVALAALVASGSAATAAPWTAAGQGGVTVDWSAGALRAPGVGPADRHAPSPAVARVAARRQAEAQARGRLAAAARALPLADGGTVGDAAERTAAVAARLEREIALAPVVQAELSTDGSARVTVALGLEAVRQAVAGPRAVSGDDGAAVTWIVEAPAAQPAVGVALAIGGARWNGPVLWVRERRDAPAAGEVVRARGAATAGVLEVSGVTAAPPAGTLVVVVVPEKKPGRRP